MTYVISFRDVNKWIINPLYRYDYNIFLLEKQGADVKKKTPRLLHQGVNLYGL